MGSLRLPFSPRNVIAAAAAALFAVSPARAQDIPQDVQTPAHLAYVDGAATLDRDAEAQPATSGMPLVAGDRVRTTTGRAEILFPDGSALDIDEYTTIELLSPTLLRLTAGRVLLTVSGSNDPDGAVRYQIDTPAASAFSDGPGEYRVALFNSGGDLETELAVLRGYAAFSTDVSSVAIGAGERSLARANGSPSAPLRFNSARYDAFDRWAAARRDERTGTLSAQYLPRDLQMYSGTFDRYGSWEHDATYGRVWYPSVAVDWRPYYYGYWAPVRHYGWTWIGADRWGWPTHHYGRWGHARNRWFWIPGRHWGPAWVSWASAPGYVSWCPLGFDNRPVFALSISIGRTWNAWTVLPRQHFGGHYYHAHRYALAPRQVVTINQFVVQNAAPVPAPRAVPRSARAVPRYGDATVAALRPAPATSARSAVINRQAAGGTAQSAVVPGGRTAVRRSGIAAAIPTNPEQRNGGTAPARVPPTAVRRGAPASPSAVAPSTGAASRRAPSAVRAPNAVEPAPTGPAARQARPRSDSGLAAPAPSGGSSRNGTAQPRARTRAPQSEYRAAPAPTPAQPQAPSDSPQYARPSRVPPTAVRRSAPSAPVYAPPQATAPAPRGEGAPRMAQPERRAPAARTAPPPQASAPPSAPAGGAPSAVPRGAARAPSGGNSSGNSQSEGSARSAPAGGRQPAARSRR